jgi:hypothetical protein
MLVILKWVGIGGMVMLEMLAPDYLATKILLIANNYRELVAIYLYLSVRLLLVYFSNLASIPSLRLIVYIV